MRRHVTYGDNRLFVLELAHTNSHGITKQQQSQVCLRVPEGWSSQSDSLSEYPTVHSKQTVSSSSMHGIDKLTNRHSLRICF